MKILVVMPFLPSPPRFGGQRRMDGMLRELAVRHEVSVLSFNRDDPWTDVSLETTRSYCKEVIAFPELDFEARDKRPLQLRSLASLHSFEHIVKAKRDDFQAALDRLLKSREYDVVQFEFEQMCAFGFERPRGRGPIFVLDEHNIEFDVLKRTAEASTTRFRKFYNALNWRKLAREERAAWQRFDGVVLTSTRDEAIINQEFPTIRTAVVPNGVDVNQFLPVTGQEEPETLLFFGAINYFPNEDGVVYFIDKIFPKIRQRRPNVRFCIVGPGAGEPVLSRRGNGVEVLGMVDEVGPYIERAAAVVVPLRIGGGTRLKIVEALSKGKAVISTRLGAEGIDAKHEEHLLLADEPETFASEVDRLLGDAGLRQRLGENARKLAEDRYSWRGIVQGLEAFYAELAARR
jgi:glycosyltransferase involved in cell wall biosynthesis